MYDAELEDGAYASAGALVDALAAKRVSALELTDAAIGRIEARDGPINAVVVRDFDRARDQARAADARIAAGETASLLGVPMTVKESHNVAGLPTTWGFEHARGFVAQTDSIGVARLKAAGAVILGKTNIPTSLGDWQSVNPIYGRTHNPWDLARTPGGSSGGGAAALAAGMVPLEFGSDIGGSIRIPAAFCGVYGHKPSYELIPQRGHMPPGLDGGGAPVAVVGPLARTAAELERALRVLAGPAPEEAVAYRLDLPPARHDTLAGFRLLMIDHHPKAALDDEVRNALEGLAARLEGRGATVARGSDRLPDLAASNAAYLDILNTAVTRGAPPQPGALSAHDYMARQDVQLGVRRQWARLFQEFDAVLAPNFGCVAYPHVEEPDPRKRTLTINGRPAPYFAQIAWPGMATFAHLPATAAPIGLSRGGLPLSVQIIGPYLEDLTPLRLAALIEREWGGFRPPPCRHTDCV